MGLHTLGEYHSSGFSDVCRSPKFLKLYPEQEDDLNRKLVEMPELSIGEVSETTEISERRDRSQESPIRDIPLRSESLDHGGPNRATTPLSPDQKPTSEVPQVQEESSATPFTDLTADLPQTAEASTAREPSEHQPLEHPIRLADLVIINDGKLYVSPKTPIPSAHLDNWQGTIKPRLERALHDGLSTMRIGNDAAMQLEFYMAGKKRASLKPSILITCCTRRRKRELKSLLGKLQWFKNSEVPYFVWVDPSWGLRTEIGMNRTPTSEAHLYGHASISLTASTLCATPAQVTHETIPVSSSIKFTIGGLVCIDDVIVCLTAGHPFVSPRQQTSASELDSDSMYWNQTDSDSDLDSEGEDSQDDNFDFTEFESGIPSKGKSKMFETEQETESTSVASSETVPLASFSYGEEIQLFPINLRLNALSNKERCLDWALLPVENRGLLLPNTIQLPNEKNPTFIDQILPRAELRPGLVWVATGSGLQRGVVTLTVASLFLWGAFHEILKIDLDQPLAHGDSGSWVIQDDHLCGHIIAGRDLFPWCYMVLVEDVFDNIRQYLPKSAELQLPSEAKIDAIKKSSSRKTANSSTHPARHGTDSYEGYVSTKTELKAAEGVLHNKPFFPQTRSSKSKTNPLYATDEKAAIEMPKEQVVPSFLFTVNELEVDGEVEPTLQNGHWYPPTKASSFHAKPPGEVYRWAGGSITRCTNYVAHEGKWWASGDMELVSYSTKSVFWCDERDEFVTAPGDVSLTDLESNEPPLNQWRDLRSISDPSQPGLSRITNAGGFYLCGTGAPWVQSLGLGVYNEGKSRDIPPATGLSGDIATIIAILAFSCRRGDLEKVLINDRAWSRGWWRDRYRESGRIKGRGLVVTIYLDPENESRSTPKWLDYLQWCEGQIFLR